MYKEVTNQKKNFRLGDLSFKVIDAFYEVHNQMGPGLLERAYHQGLLLALKKRNLSFQSEVTLYAKFDDVPVAGYQADVIVEDELIVEVKAVKRLEAVMEAQVINYLYLSGLSVGLLVNFAGASVEVRRFDNRNIGRVKGRASP